jgi:hypothetical protein
MDKLTKQVLKNEARKVYEVNARKVPKRNRIPFSQFFKQYLKMKKQEQNPVPVEEQQQRLPDALEDFNFNEMVNVNQVDENSIVVEETPVEKEPKE